MAFIFRLTRLLVCLLLVVTANAQARNSHHQNADFGEWLHRESSSFDYYLLALSWSPEFCQTPAGQQPAKKMQCTSKLGFVVHGLWPQYNSRDYPHDCGPEVDVPAEVSAIAENAVPPMPPGDRQLFNHEWQKHGTCSGLSMTEYFTAIKISAEKVKIPEELKSPPIALTLDAKAIATAFTRINPGLSEEMFNIETDRMGNINGVQICFDKQLNFRACSGGHTLQGGTFLPVH